ncbi:PDZ domain-containing protein [Aneurinibacillus uraniidurans]|uniref:PDZ domain-containing protein n=1 Tax=Aneurinibacillus uraniidurans TaxID=2966586 RepID=UPI00234B55BC|nr:PDZ domain-containing protein [Aneurinibacillus sp. B1]WCN38179.1 PDZ domain-containing protein [Aneurinibacillus sp. B1]
MIDWSTFLVDLLIQIPRTLLSPALYAFILLLFWYASRQIKQERRLFSVRVTSAPREIVQALVPGIIVGAAISILLLGFGIALSYFDVLSLWIGSLLLGLIAPRFAAAGYAGGVLIVLSALFRQVDASGTGLFASLAGWMQQVHAPAIAALLGLLYVAEGILLRRPSLYGCSPMLLTSQRGLVVGAYRVRRLWLVPLITFIADGTGSYSFVLPSGWPWWAGAAVLSLLPLPLMIGHEDTAIVATPDEQMRRPGTWIMGLGLLIFVLGYLGTYWLPFAVLGGVLALAGHGTLRMYSRWQQKLHAPLYVQRNKGVCVLGVLPGSPADEMEIVTGDVIMRVNGQSIAGVEDLYPALQQQSAFCKMEVLNRDGHIKYVQRSVYQGDHHQLGLILAPEATGEMVGVSRMRRGGLLERNHQPMDEPESSVPLDQGKDVSF